jgi:hypothetical protein
MNNIRTALHEFWSDFYNRSSLLTEPLPIPAFPAGYAGGAFPYITYEVVRAPFGGLVKASANIWDRDVKNPGFFSVVDDVLAQAAERIPAGGTALDLGGDGGMILYRAEPFIDFLTDPDDPTIVRGTISYIIKNYVI